MEILEHRHTRTSQTLILHESDYNNMELFRLNSYGFEMVFIENKLKSNKNYEKVMTLIFPYIKSAKIYYYD